MNRKATIIKRTSPDMMEVCEVRYEFHDNTYPVVMEYFVNKNLDYVNLNKMNEIGVNEEGREKNYGK